MSKEELAEKVFGGINSCSEHPISVRYADVARVLAAWDSAPEEPTDRDGWCLVELHDGRFASVWDSDYTARGCQCSGGASFFATEEQAWTLGLTAKQRADAGH